MQFTSKPDRNILGFFLLLSAFSIGVSEYKEVTIFQVMVTCFLLVSLMTSFHLKIEGKHLLYEVFIGKIKVYRRKALPEDIEEMKFKRAGWMKKMVMIKRTKGFNWRILHFQPEDIYKELELYAYQEAISVQKAKDYHVLEK